MSLGRGCSFQWSSSDRLGSGSGSGSGSGGNCCSLLLRVLQEINHIVGPRCCCCCRCCCKDFLVVPTGFVRTLWVAVPANNSNISSSSSSSNNNSNGGRDSAGYLHRYHQVVVIVIVIHYFHDFVIASW